MKEADTPQAPVFQDEAGPGPTKGRIVLFTDPHTGESIPAIVTAVRDGKVHVCAFDPIMGPGNHCCTGQGYKPGEWHWPQRNLEGARQSSIPIQLLKDLVRVGVEEQFKQYLANRPAAPGENAEQEAAPGYDSMKDDAATDPA